jgi:hypothetical protein
VRRRAASPAAPLAEGVHRIAAAAGTAAPPARGGAPHARSPVRARETLERNPRRATLSRPFPLPPPSSLLPRRSWARNAARHGDLVALEDPHHPGAPRVTYAQLHGQILDCGAGLRAMGLEPGERVRQPARRGKGSGLQQAAGRDDWPLRLAAANGAPPPAPSSRAPPQVCLFSEDSSRWLVADQGIMAAGAADAVRRAAGRRPRGRGRGRGQAAVGVAGSSPAPALRQAALITLLHPAPAPGARVVGARR